MTGNTTLRAFARLIGRSEGAVRKAIANGRLELSVGRDARRRPFIADLALARREWDENADPSRVRS